MKTSSEEAIFDTNVLLYAMNEASDRHHASKELRDLALSRVIKVFLTPQVLFEYFAVVTNPNELDTPLSAKEALNDIRKLAVSFPIIHPPADLHERVFKLLDETNFSARHIFDLQLAATMLANEITRIYSYDERFDRIPGITRLIP